MRKAGDILERSQVVKKATAMTPHVVKLLDAAVLIRDEPGTLDKAAYMARELVQCTLPHSDPGQVPFWARTSGNITLSIISACAERPQPVRSPA